VVLGNDAALSPSSQFLAISSKHGVSLFRSHNQLHRSQLQSPDKFYKRSQEKKHLSRGRIFSWLPAHCVEQDCSGLPFRVLGTLLHLASAFGLLCQRFSSLSRNEASPFGDHKQHGCQVPTMVLLGTHGPQLFRVVRGGLAWIIRDFAGGKRKGALKD
jgi:hypothetical protein